MTPYTRLSVTATPGRNYGSFAGKEAEAPTFVTPRFEGTLTHPARMR